jgi:probable phosphoglycerate mutase
LAGFGEKAEVDTNLVEWNYGEYEGLTSKQIHEKRPGWMIFTDGCPGGETPEQVGARADRAIVRVRTVRGDVALFAHGHILRVLVARWLGFQATAGRHFLLHTGTLNVLSYYQGIPAVKIWNAPLISAE